jgi:hypothetical protein
MDLPFAILQSSFLVLRFLRSGGGVARKDAKTRKGAKVIIDAGMVYLNNEH